jgi:NADPH-dependent 2,4-dienoyl-CoA reductase/sulfur reductase-like enzyme
MPRHKYLIVGGGMTADAAVKGIRQVDAQGEIGIMAKELHRPYSRPPLSKALWKGEPEESIWRNTPTTNITFYAGRSAKSLKPESKQVLDDQGTVYVYEKLLLATGGSVRRLPWEAEGIIYYRTLDDYRQLRTLTQKGASIIVIGGGFIGSEIAAALALQKVKVTMLFPEEGIGARIYPRTLVGFLNTYYGARGVNVRSGAGVTGIKKRGSGFVVSTSGGEELAADGVVAGVGIRPDTELAQAAGLTVDNGIHVDQYLRTSHPDIFAAGDVANFPNPALGKRIRVEHEDNALTMGELAGKNMAGSDHPYDHLPSFYSDLFDIGYEAVGELDVRMTVVEDWKVEFREGVIYYHQENRVRGVLLWNVWKQVDAARALIAEPGPIDVRSLKGRLPA